VLGVERYKIVFLEGTSYSKT